MFPEDYVDEWFRLNDGPDDEPVEVDPYDVGCPDEGRHVCPGCKEKTCPFAK